MLLQSIWLLGATWNQKQFTQRSGLGGVCIQTETLCFSVPPRGTLSGAEPFSWAENALCMGDGDWTICLGLEGTQSSLTYL